MKPNRRVDSPAGAMVATRMGLGTCEAEKGPNLLRPRSG
jgi:hypothetical protein